MGFSAIASLGHSLLFHPHQWMIQGIITSSWNEWAKLGELGLCSSLEDSHLPIFISNDFRKARQHHLFSRLLQ